MNDRIDFLNVFYPVDVKYQRMNILNELVRFVSDGVMNEYGPPYVPDYIVTFENAVKVALFEHFSFDPNLPKSFRAKCGDTYTLIKDAYERAFGWHRPAQLCVPWLPKDLTKAFKEDFSCIDTVNDFEPSVIGMFNCAKSNFAVVESQIASLSVIYSLLLKKHSSNFRLAGMDEIRQELYVRREKFMMNYLLASALSGNTELLKQATVDVTTSTLHNPEAKTQYSIIQYITAKGRVPGHYFTADDEALRSDIKKCFDALKN